MRKGAAGVAQLNARLQALLNPPAPDRAELPLGGSASSGVMLRVGDRVIQVQPLVQPKSESESYSRSATFVKSVVCRQPGI